MTEAFTNSDIQYPPGTIIMWDSHPDQIPHGWVFCDGNNGTQDMRNKVAMSVPDGSTDPGSAVGTDSYSLSKAQLPSHSHSSSTDTVGSHTHGGISKADGYSDDGSDGSTGEEPANTSSPDGSYKTVSGGSHSHSISTGSTGSGNSIDNRPKEQTVNFIQKT